MIALLAAGVVLSTFLVYRHGIGARNSEARSRQQVTATVLGWTDTKVIGNPYLVASRVDVSFPFQHGTQKDSITTTDPVRPGDKLTIWVDDSGQLVRAPRTLWTVGYDTTLTAVLGVIGIVLLVAGLRTWFDGWVQCHHLDQWEREWAALDRDHQD
jgi:hypothetical protein